MTRTIKDVLLVPVKKKELKLSPYKFISDMQDEFFEDQILRSIGIIVQCYITKDDIVDVTDEELYGAKLFVIDKINYIGEIKSMFELQNSDIQISEMMHTIDLITVETELDNIGIKMIYYLLQCQINALEDKLSLYFLTLTEIIKERNDN